MPGPAVSEVQLSVVETHRWNATHGGGSVHVWSHVAVGGRCYLPHALHPEMHTHEKEGAGVPSHNVPCMLCLLPRNLAVLLCSNSDSYLYWNVVLRHAAACALGMHALWESGCSSSG